MWQTYFWERALAPLVEFVAAPYPAGDRVGETAYEASVANRPRQRKKRSGLRHDIGLVGYYLRNGGPSVVVTKIKRRLRRAKR